MAGPQCLFLGTTSKRTHTAAIIRSFVDQECSMSFERDKVNVYVGFQMQIDLTSILHSKIPTLKISLIESFAPTGSSRSTS